MDGAVSAEQEQDTRALLVRGDCLEFLKRLDDNSIDSVVTDPPAGIAFMGAEWDRMKRAGMTELQAFQEFICEVFTEVYRVLKPGGHAVVWALPRTSHHTAMGLERSGFDIRDQGTYLFHVFGSGFPKSHNLDGEHKGFGTALKPAVEFWILVRKPVEGTVAENVLKYGTGALNIDGCRVGSETVSTHSRGSNEAYPKRPNEKTVAESGRKKDQRIDLDTDTERTGRWPAHLILDEGAAALLDAQSGVSKSTKGKPRASKQPGEGWGMTSTGAEYEDEGGASRFFYVPKAAKRDKDEGLDALAVKTAGEKTNRTEGSAGITPYAGSRGPSKNSHPTVKSTALMTWLVRLVTPPGGVVLDPFMGSGSTGKAALREGFQFVGCEREQEYMEIAKARIEHELGGPVDVLDL